MQHSTKYLDKNIGENFKWEYLKKYMPDFENLEKRIKDLLDKDVHLQFCFNEWDYIANLDKWDNGNIFTRFSQVATGTTQLNSEMVLCSLCQYLKVNLNIDNVNQAYWIS